MKMTPDTALQVLRGEAINAVAFVMDYVELHFNGSILRCIADPIVECQGSAIRFPETGSRDALCALIGDRVIDITTVSDDAITIALNSGCRVRVPLGPADASDGEWAHFVPGVNQPMLVW